MFENNFEFIFSGQILTQKCESTIFIRMFLSSWFDDEERFRLGAM